MTAKTAAKIATPNDDIDAIAQAAYEAAFANHDPKYVDSWTDLVTDNDPSVESWRAVARAVQEASRSQIRIQIAEEIQEWRKRRMCSTNTRWAMNPGWMKRIDRAYEESANIAENGLEQ